MPACPVCGTSLRWFPELNAWGCDRCQQMIAPATAGRGRAPARRSRTTLFVVVGVGAAAAVAAIVALVAGRGDDSVDCDRYIDKHVELELEGRTGEDRDTMEHRLRALYSDQCWAHRVTRAEAECVQAASTREAAGRCFGIGESSTPPAASAPAEKRAASAVEVYFGLMAEFDAAFGEGGGDCDNRVPRVEGALAAARPKRDQLVSLLSDPAVAPLALPEILHPNPTNRDVRQHFASLFIDGANESCHLQDRWQAFIEPAERLLQAAYQAVEGKVPEPPRAPPPDASAVEEGMPPHSGLAECDALVALRARVEACAALPENTRTALIEMIYNNLYGFRTGVPKNEDYREYVRSKCAGTGQFATENLAAAGCG
jgi:hypothetical protein